MSDERAWLTKVQLESLPIGTEVVDYTGRIWKRSGRVWLSGTTGMSVGPLARRDVRVKL